MIRRGSRNILKLFRRFSYIFSRSRAVSYATRHAHRLLKRKDNTRSAVSDFPISRRPVSTAGWCWHRICDASRRTKDALYSIWGRAARTSGGRADRSSAWSAGDPRPNCAPFERGDLRCRQGGEVAVIDALGRICAASRADGSICYNSKTGHGKMFWVGITCNMALMAEFHAVHQPRNSVRFCGNGGSRRKGRQQGKTAKCWTCGKSMKTRRGRSSVG